MESIICDAINTHRVLKIYYPRGFRGGYRFIEPHCCGVGKANEELLRAFQTSGHSNSNKPHDWKLLTVAEIESIVMTGDEFQAPRPGYVRNDLQILRIYCQL
jgi:hypothetical protein